MGRNKSGASLSNSHFKIFSGASGLAQGSAWLTEIWPPLAKLVSSAASGSRSITQTESPARAIHRFPEIGTLSAGRTADVAVFELQSGVFALKDSWGNKLLAREKLEAVLTVRNGEIVYDLNGLAFPLWTTAGEYQTIR